MKKFVEQTQRPEGLENVGYIQGTAQAKGRKFAIIASRFNPELTEASIRSALDALLADPVYRARHEAFGEFLDQYEDAARIALQRAIDCFVWLHQASAPNQAPLNLSARRHG